MKKITKDEILKVVKKHVKLYYNNILGKPFLRLDDDNNHIQAFKYKKCSMHAPNIMAYRGLWFKRKEKLN